MKRGMKATHLLPDVVSSPLTPDRLRQTSPLLQCHGVQTTIARLRLGGKVYVKQGEGTGTVHNSMVHTLLIDCHITLHTRTSNDYLVLGR